MVRRTRSFIIQHYTEVDNDKGRHYVRAATARNATSQRAPPHVKLQVNDSDPHDRYARLYSLAVVDEINALHVPRYGLGNYVDLQARKARLRPQSAIDRQPGRAASGLWDFAAPTYSSGLESTGIRSCMSIDRHVLRNEIYIYAIENGLDLPVGVLDARRY